METIDTTKKAITFITKKGYTIKNSFEGYVSIIKNGCLENIIKYSELIKFAEILKTK